MRSITLAAVGSALLLGAMVALLIVEDSPSGATSTRLKLYCAAGIKLPVEAVAREYEREYGVRIETTFEGSGALLSKIKVLRFGDLYLAGDDSFIDLAETEGLIADRVDLARMVPVIGVARGNPKRVASLSDLERPGIRLGVANPDAAAIGRVCRMLLSPSGAWQRLEAIVHVQKPTVTDLANDLVVGALDAALIWDATANQYEEIDTIRLPVLEASPRNVTIGVLTSSHLRAEATRFARYLASRDRGLPHFAQHGYTPIGGDGQSPLENGDGR